MPLPSPGRLLQRTSVAIMVIVVTPAVLMIGATSICLIAYARVGASLDDIVKSSLPASHASSDAELALTKMGVETLKAAAVYDLELRRKHLAEARHQGQVLSQASERLLEIPFSEEGRRRAVAIAESAPNLVQTHRPIWVLLDECTVFATEDALELFASDVPPLQRKVFESIAAFKSYHQNSVKQRNATAERSLEFSEKSLLVGNVFTSALGLGLGMLLSRRILKRVRLTLQTLKKVADGDLSARLELDSQGEFGEIAEATNRAIAASQQTLEALSNRNRDIQTLLDSVDEGFFTIDHGFIISEERSGAVERMLAAPKQGETFPDFIRRFDETTGDWLEFALQEVFGRILPVEVTIDQVPKRFEHEGQTFAIRCSPFTDADNNLKLAVVLSDITGAVQQEVLETRQREMMAIVSRITEDQVGFMEFYKEANSLVALLSADEGLDITLTQRRLHTLKGNASIFGLERLGGVCHEMEQSIVELDALPEDGTLERLIACWTSVTQYVEQIMGGKSDRLEIQYKEYDETVIAVLNRTPHEQIATRMVSWTLEATEIRMNRVREQAIALANRLGKGEISVRCTGGHLRLAPTEWSGFWAAFVHIIRNAIDHGLETPEERVRVGKPQSGTLELSTTVDDEHFIIKLSDDGRGIDWDKIRQLAQERNLPCKSDQELLDVLTFDGVTTRETASEISGRGIGMSAVRECCRSLGGELFVESKFGVGTTISFHFPINQMAPKMFASLESFGMKNPYIAAIGN
ncbi:Hpt domain-containing protein [Stieleria sp. JC731]|uniref:ATP-binding protein n=1 Tax=Pirellulaceae TaxID=2691357 RepID=UPI001E361825|nr:ATP-binding protein [Stieleria sp. JC731]MCC9603585.1 Hpt domain-containing protein [Stieleria sp. JC731]